MTTTRREECLAKLDQVITAAMTPFVADIVLKDRNTALAVLIDTLSAAGNAKGVAVLLDGDPQEPTPLLGEESPIWDHVQTAMFQFIAIHDDTAKRTALVDAVILAIDTALRADLTLGGVCDLVQCQVPAFSELELESVPEGKACELPINILFSSNSATG